MTLFTDHQNVDVISIGNKNVYLVGTAHVSQSSVDLVKEVIEAIKPEYVAVELCESRFDSLRNPDKWRETNIVSIIRQGKSYLLMTQLILSAFQKKIGAKLEVKPGAEMMAAIELAESNNSETALVDREIKITLRRAWASLGWWGSIKLFGALIASFFNNEEISEEEIEKLKSSDALEAMISELSENLPGVQQSLIDERDQYLAAKIKDIPSDSVVAIVGAGHVPGIKKYIHQDISLDQLEVIPPSSIITKSIAWAIPVIIIGMILYGFFNAGSDASVEMIKSWVYANSFFSALGAVMALAHPLTILAAAVAAPFTSLNPFIAAGWVAGLCEAVLRKPRIADLESIGDDITTMGGIWKNRLSRILLIIALTNLGSMIGTAIGIPLVASFL